MDKLLGPEQMPSEHQLK